MKKILNKILSFITASLLMLQFMPSLTFAAPSESDYGNRIFEIIRNAQNTDDEILIQNEIPSVGVNGDCNETTVHWNLSADGTLTFSGAGAIEYEESNNMPWNEYFKEIKKLVIGSGITKINLVPFADFISIEETEVEEGNEAYCSIDGVLFNKDKTVLEFFPAASSVTEYTVPSTVKTLASASFAGCSKLQKVSIPTSVTTIETGAFLCCTSLESVKIPYGVTRIEGYTFSYCTSLSSVTFPPALTSIGDLAFSDCISLTSVTVPPMVTYIGACAFNIAMSEKEPSLQSVYFTGNAPEKVGDFAFDSAKVTVYYNQNNTGWSDNWKGYKTQKSDKIANPNIDCEGDIDVLDVIILKNGIEAMKNTELSPKDRETGIKTFDLDGNGIVDNDDLFYLTQLILNK